MPVTTPEPSTTEATTVTTTTAAPTMTPSVTTASPLIDAARTDSSSNAFSVEEPLHSDKVFEGSGCDDEELCESSGSGKMQFSYSAHYFYHNSLQSFQRRLCSQNGKHNSVHSLVSNLYS